MSKFIDSLVKIVRMPERIAVSRTEVQVSKNVGIAPDGTLRAMRKPATLLRQSKLKQAGGSDVQSAE